MSCYSSTDRISHPVPRLNRPETTLWLRGCHQLPTSAHFAKRNCRSGFRRVPVAVVNRRMQLHGVDEVDV